MAMLRSTFMLLWLTITTSSAQPKIDSLTQALAIAPTEQKFEILQALHDQYKLSDYAKALDYAKEAYKQARLQGDSVKIVEGGRMVAFSLSDLGKNQQAIGLLDTCLQIARRNEKRLPQIQPNIKSILNNMGLAAMDLAQFDKALSYLFQSLILREEEGNQKYVAVVLLNIGLVYYRLSDEENALKYFERSISIKTALNDSTNIDLILANMSHCYRELKQYTKAIALAKKAIRVCEGDCIQITIDSNISMAWSYLYLNALNDSEYLYLKTLKMAEEVNASEKSILCLLGLGRIELKRKNYGQSLHYLLKARGTSNVTEYPMLLMNIHEELASVYKQKEDLKNAFQHQSIQLQLQDSIFNSEYTRKLTNVQTEHQERENRKALAEKDKLVTLQAEAIQTQQKISLFIALIALLSIVVIATIYRNYRMRLRINKVLEEKVKARTRELEESRDQALRTTYEREHRLTRLTTEVQSMVATIHGLCAAAGMDGDNKNIYLKKLSDYMATLKTSLYGGQEAQ